MCLASSSFIPKVQRLGGGRLLLAEKKLAYRKDRRNGLQGQPSLGGRAEAVGCTHTRMNTQCDLWPPTSPLSFAPGLRRQIGWCGAAQPG